MCTDMEANRSDSYDTPCLLPALRPYSLTQPRVKPQLRCLGLMPRITVGF